LGVLALGRDLRRAHVWRGSFFRLEDHLDRFERGMERLRMSLPYSREEIRDVLVECVRLSGLRDAYVEVVCACGVPPPGSRDPRESENSLFAFAKPFVWTSSINAPVFRYSLQ
jgi:branched-chain amino acid aminotransferase